MVEFDPLGAWILLIGGSLLGALAAVARERRRLDRPTRRFIAAGPYLDAVMLGIGADMGVVVIILLLAATLTRLS